ncbi:MAG: terminase family protein [Bacteroidota bacterium]
MLACGRRFGKTTLGLDLAVGPALGTGDGAGLPVAWFAPTYPMMLEVWRDAARLLRPIATKVNAQERRIELVTGGVVEFWSLTNPDDSRGRKYARAVLDEAAMVRDLLDAWNAAIRPTLVDYEGDAYFLSTPKGRTDFHTLFLRGQDPEADEWQSWQMPTATNPHVPPAEVEAMRRELPPRVFSQEVLADFVADVEGALWTYALVDRYRLGEGETPPEMKRIVVGVDPAGGGGDEIGIVCVGLGTDGHAYVLDDASLTGSPDAWGRAVAAVYDRRQADRVVAEKNYGGDMVEHVLRTVDPTLAVSMVTATRGKSVRAEPVAALYEQGKVHHVGAFGRLEEQMTTWDPADRRAKSPDRLDALVWALTETALRPQTDHTRVF